MGIILLPSKCLTNYDSTIFKIAFHPKTSTLAITGQNGVWLWDTEQEQQAKPFVRGNIIQSTFHPSGSLLATTENRRLRLWDLLEKKELWSKTLQEKKQSQFLEVWDAAFSPDGKLLASVDTTAIRLRDVTEGKVLWQRRWVTDAIYSVAFSPDGRSLAAGDGMGCIHLWHRPRGWSPDTLAGQPLKLHKMCYPAIGIWCLAFSPDGQFLASSASLSNATPDPAGSIVRLWNVASGENVCQFSGFVNDVSSLAFSPDGRFLAAAGDQTVRLWNVNTAEETWSLQEPDKQQQPLSVAWNFDGRFLAIARRKEIQLWQLSNSQ